MGAEVKRNCNGEGLGARSGHCLPERPSRTGLVHLVGGEARHETFIHFLESYFEFPLLTQSEICVAARLSSSLTSVLVDLVDWGGGCGMGSEVGGIFM